MILRILGISVLLLLCGCSRTPQGLYHLKPWPILPKYSNSFYTNMLVKDRELMDKREWQLNEFKLDAQKLEAMHNSRFEQ